MKCTNFLVQPECFRLLGPGAAFSLGANGDKSEQNNSHPNVFPLCFSRRRSTAVIRVCLCACAGGPRFQHKQVVPSRPIWYLSLNQQVFAQNDLLQLHGGSKRRWPADVATISQYFHPVWAAGNWRPAVTVRGEASLAAHHVAPCRREGIVWPLSIHAPVTWHNAAKRINCGLDPKRAK